MKRWIGALGGITVAASVAHADDSAGPRQGRHVPISLTWQSSGENAGCVTAEGLERTVEAMLERKVFVHDATAEASIRGTLQCAGMCETRVVMTKADGQPLGERDLKSAASSCTELREAIAVILSVAIDSLETEVVRLSLPERPAADKPWRGWLGPMASASYGRMPGVAVGFGLTGHIEPPELWPFEGTLVEWTSTSREDGSLGANFSGWQASLASCPLALRRPSIVIEACLGAEIARLQAVGTGLDVNRNAHSWIPSALGEAIVLVPLGRRFALTAPVVLEVPFVRDPFVYGRDGTPILLYRPAAVSLFAGLGFAVTIP